MNNLRRPRLVAALYGVLSRFDRLSMPQTIRIFQMYREVRIDKPASRVTVKHHETLFLAGIKV